jgi:hypothetical protein
MGDNEWVPRELLDARPALRLRRLSTNERLERRAEQGRPDGAERSGRFEPEGSTVRTRTAEEFPYSIPEPRPDGIWAELFRRIVEVEDALANATAAINRTADRLRTMVEQDGRPGRSDGSRLQDHLKIR